LWISKGCAFLRYSKTLAKKWTDLVSGKSGPLVLIRLRVLSVFHVYSRDGGQLFIDIGGAGPGLVGARASFGRG